MAKQYIMPQIYLKSERKQNYKFKDCIPNIIKNQLEKSYIFTLLTLNRMYILRYSILEIKLRKT